MDPPRYASKGESLEPKDEARAWGLGLFAAQLKDGLRELQRFRHDLALDNHVPTGPKIDDTVAAVYRATTALEDLERIIETLERHLRPSNQVAAFGDTGQPADRAAITRLSSSVIDGYLSILNWAVELRETDVPAEARPVYRELCHLADVPLSAIESFVFELSTTIDEIERGNAKGLPEGLTKTLYITITMDAAVMAPVAAAMRSALATIPTESDPELQLEGHLDDEPMSEVAAVPIRSFHDAERAALNHIVSLGYSDAVTTAAGRDGGIDIIADGMVAHVTAQVEPVGAPQVQQLVGIAASHGSRAFFYALSGYTSAAHAFATANEVCLFEFDLAGSVRPSNTWADALQRMAPRQSPADFGCNVRVEQRWITAGPTASVITQSRSHILANNTDIIHVLEEATGAITWSEALPRGDEFHSLAAIVGGNVVIAVERVMHIRNGFDYATSELMAFDATSSGECWRVSIDGGVRMSGENAHETLLPVLVSPYLETLQVWLVDVRTGKTMWRAQLPDSDIVSMRLGKAAFGLVFVTVQTEKSEFLVALDLRSGQEAWRRQTYNFPVAPNAVCNRSWVTSDRVYVASSPIHGSRLHCLGRDGTLFWLSREMIREPFHLVQVASEVVAVTTTDETMAFSLNDGTVLWKRSGFVLWIAAFGSRFLISEARGAGIYLTWLHARTGRTEAVLQADGSQNFLPEVDPCIRSDGLRYVITSGVGDYVTQHWIWLEETSGPLLS